MPINSFLYPGAKFIPGYEVANSCRFNDGDSPSMSKTQGTATNVKIFTVSMWVKRCTFGADQHLWETYLTSDAANDRVTIQFMDSNRFRVKAVDGGSTVLQKETSRLCRDPSAWYHIVVAVDTTDSTAANRCKIYINGTQETSFSTDTIWSQDVTPEQGTSSYTNIIGKYGGGSNYFDGYMAEVVFIDGQQLTPTSFGEFDEDSPTIWKPIDVSGLTFGTNGFYLDFEASDNLGNDANGGTDFTETNLAATDQATDTPTNNFATLNPLNFGHGSLSEGNLKWTASAQVGNLAFGTIGIDMDVSNQFYWETKIEGGEIVIGIAPTTLRWNDTGRAGSYGYYSDGNKYSGTSASSYGASFTTNDIIGVLVGNGTLTFYKNGASQGTAFSSLSGTYLPFLAEVGSTNSMNFGSPPYSISSGNTDPEGYGNFEYSTNSGYALNTKNLAEYG